MDGCAGADVRGVFSRFFNGVKGSEIAKKICTLKLTGCLEDYLVKEFAWHFIEEHRGRLFIALNLEGRREKKRVRPDISFLRASGADKCEIIGIVEAKYLTNGIRDEKGSGNGYGKGLGQLTRQLEDLRGIQEFKICHKKDKYEFKKKPEVFGFVAAAFVPKKESEEKNARAEAENWFDRLETDARKNFRPEDDPNLFERIYDNYVSMLGERRFVDFRMGLWRLNK